MNVHAGWYRSLLAAVAVAAVLSGCTSGTADESGVHDDAARSPAPYSPPETPQVPDLPKKPCPPDDVIYTEAWGTASVTAKVCAGNYVAIESLFPGDPHHTYDLGVVRDGKISLSVPGNTANPWQRQMVTCLNKDLGMAPKVIQEFFGCYRWGSGEPSPQQAAVARTVKDWFTAVGSLEAGPRYRSSSRALCDLYASGAQGEFTDAIAESGVVWPEYDCPAYMVTFIMANRWVGPRQKALLRATVDARRVQVSGDRAAVVREAYSVNPVDPAGGLHGNEQAACRDTYTEDAIIFLVRVGDAWKIRDLRSGSRGIAYVGCKDGRPA
ncbi:hypothetical protein [Streptomyces acidiscabies]|uniref:hypothetical protein n=1 Tax=Streptomyces acidiscabies TaxID=42234 RepID=UPI000950CA76|nr:hypothetical protein [Streptomyces acidiscabies]